MLHIASLDLKTVLNCAKTYLLQGVGIFLAVSPLIALVSKLKRGYWLALIFAEIYSFLGLFLGNGALRYIYLTRLQQHFAYRATTKQRLIMRLFFISLK